MGAAAVIRWWQGECLWWPVYDRWPRRTLDYVRKHLADLGPLLELAGPGAADQLVVQAGGHVGQWPAVLARHFGRVLTCEPDPALAECLRRNLAGLRNIEVHELALAPVAGRLRMVPDHRAGSWAVSATGTVEVACETIDTLVGGAAVGAIVLDVEGYELSALEGARRTLERCRPLLHLEVWARQQEAVACWLQAVGYRRHIRVSKDEVWVPA
jgi:FkbM family methyltransferase